MKLALAALVLVAGLTACDTGPACIKSHTELQSQVQVVPEGYSMGGVPLGNNLEIHQVPVEVCDEYETTTTGMESN